MAYVDEDGVDEDLEIDMDLSTIEAGSVQVLNESGVDSEAVLDALGSQHAEFAAVRKWVSSHTSWSNGRKGSRKGSIFDRDKYLAPDSVAENMVVACEALANDDVVSGAADLTESLAFNKMSIDAEDIDETDIWNQIAADLDFDRRLREMWREQFTVSQFYVAVWWGTKTYQVRGRTQSGNARRKKFANLKVPIKMSILDPLKVFPAPSKMFGEDVLLYAASDEEVVAIDSGNDGVFKDLIVGPYEWKGVWGENDGFPTRNLYTLNPESVFRHAATKSQYDRFSAVRLRSIFELLDLKRQLRALDRSVLLGSTNYLLLIKKGSEAHPGKNEEIRSLQSQVKSLAKVPVLVGDHRLNVEIVTPKNDKTLDVARHNGLDSRITARLFGVLSSGNYSAGTKGDDSIKLARMIGRYLESERHLIRRTLEKHILKATYDANPQFSYPPKLRFHPKRIALDFDATHANFLLDLRDRGDLSRESILEELDFDQDLEYRRRKTEIEQYDEVFESITPWGPKNIVRKDGDEDPEAEPPTNPRTAGRRLGGNRNGGGANVAPRRSYGEGDE